MLRLRIDEPNVPSRRVDVLAPFTIVGGRGDPDRYAIVRLEGTEESVLWIYREGTSYSAEAASGAQVLRNGQPMTGFDSFLNGDVFTCEGITLTVEPAATLTRDEFNRLSSLLKGGAAARDVFLDELESAGRTAEAAYLRALVNWELRGSETARATLEDLAGSVDVSFRAQVADVPLERCREASCPARWTQLKLSLHSTQRLCHTCKQAVQFCDTVSQARALAAVSRVVAVEPARVRERDDLDTSVAVG
jgi:hypothetical protein